MWGLLILKIIFLVTVTDLEEKLEKLTKENAYLEKSLETKKKDNHEMAEKIRDLDA